MKEFKLYQCECCNTQYKEKKMAIECEKSHKYPDEVEALKYRSLNSNPSGFPDSVMVRFSDGSKAKYEFKGEIK